MSEGFVSNRDLQLPPDSVRCSPASDECVNTDAVWTKQGRLDRGGSAYVIVLVLGKFIPTLLSKLGKYSSDRYTPIQGPGTIPHPVQYSCEPLSAVTNIRLCDAPPFYRGLP